METLKQTTRGLLCLLFMITAATLQAQQLPEALYEQFGTADDVDAASHNVNFNLATGKATPANINLESLSYRPSANLREATVAACVARLKPSNAALAESVNQMFGAKGRYDYSEMFNSMVEAYGLSANNTADALAANLVLGYLMANNIKTEVPVSATAVAAVRRQFGYNLLNNAKLGIAGNAAKLSEELKLQFVIQRLGWLAAVKKGTSARYSKKVNADLKNRYGMDMTKVQLTADGFVNR